MVGSARALFAVSLCALSLRVVVAAPPGASENSTLWVSPAQQEADAKLSAAAVARARIPAGLVSGEGWFCQDLNDVNRRTRPQVREFMNRYDFLDEYERLKEALRNTPRGTWWAWKGSELDKALFVEGEKSFHRQNITTLLTKEWGFWRSVFKICFVAEGATPGHEVLDNLYQRDGRGVRTSCDGGYKWMPPGVAAQQLNLGKRSAPHQMSLEVFRQLYKKDALSVHAEYAEKILSQPLGWFPSWIDKEYWNILVTEVFKERFAAKTEGIFFNQKASSCWECWEVCDDDPNGHSHSDCRTECGWVGYTHTWLEYADFDIVGESYMPPDGQHHIRRLLKWANCHQNSPVTQLAAEVNWTSMIDTSGCGQVVGAGGRNSVPYPGCKCGYGEEVRCGEQVFDGRKFDMETLMQWPECKIGSMYCGKRVCDGFA